MNQGVRHNILMKRMACYSVLLLAGLWLAPCFLNTLPREALAAVVTRVELESGVYAAIKNGRVLYLECLIPDGARAKALLGRYLADENDWETYKGRMAVAIPYMRLNRAAQRQILEAIFPKDYVNPEGWWHTVVFDEEEGLETWWSISEWLTGKGTNYKQLRALEANQRCTEPLEKGQVIFVPAALLPEAFRAPVVSVPASTPEETLAPAAAPKENGELKFGKDVRGEYAEYKLKKGETLYSSVIARFTDFRENEHIQQACEVIQERSGIQNTRKMHPGQRILIPLDIISDQYHPKGSERRSAYEAVQEEARRLKGVRLASKDLADVVIILDPGHGGRDHGAAPPYAKRLGLYEDEISYDIACRIKRLLESQTQAKVYMTLKDISQGFTPRDTKRFTHDSDEELLTTPTYSNLDARRSANLRWYLANDIYRKELKRGIDKHKILFASIHCDALYDGRMRGTMVYVPGAKYRNGIEQGNGSFYNRFAEVRAHRQVKTSLSEWRRDEALSRNFAETLLYHVRHHNPPLKVPRNIDPIRNVIRRSRNSVFVPAVLRGTEVPTKVLVEAANLTNSTDCKRLADPDWREWFAEAFVNAVKKHFDS